ncbi:uncharacterized protein LOC144762439 [Lissotriton helveticus]
MRALVAREVRKRHTVRRRDELHGDFKACHCKETQESLALLRITSLNVRWGRQEAGHLVAAEKKTTAGRLQWTEEGLRQEGAGNRKKEEPAAAPVEANEGLERAGVPAPKDLFSGRLQWTEEGLRQEGAGIRKKEEPAAAPVEANEGLERAGVPAPKDLFLERGLHFLSSGQES